MTKKATPLDTKFFHSNGLNYDLSNQHGLKNAPFLPRGLFLTLLYTSDPTSILSGALNDVS